MTWDDYHTGVFHDGTPVLHRLGEKCRLEYRLQPEIDFWAA